MFEDTVVEGDRGGHTEREEVKGSDQGTDNKGEDDGGVNQQIEIATTQCLVNIEVKKINVLCLVDGC